MGKAIESIGQAIKDIEKEMEVILREDEFNMLERAKKEAIKCLTTLRYINQ